MGIGVVIGLDVIIVSAPVENLDNWNSKEQVDLNWTLGFIKDTTFLGPHPHQPTVIDVGEASIEQFNELIVFLILLVHLSQVNFVYLKKLFRLF